MTIRLYREEDEPRVIDLWTRCNLTVPWNNPGRDIERKMADRPDLFFIGEIGGEIGGEIREEIKGKIVATCMAGYDGHRGWIYYLAVEPDLHRRGIARRIMRRAEERLKEIGCPKINLMVRDTNTSVIDFYHTIGYGRDPVVVLSKRLEEDPEYQVE
ncbi:MAG: GNAT family acetyltransferase [Desulfobacterales bacterium]|nr:GNAT family acetyltransferase [Desulfobacterales bacterium]